MTQYSLDHYWTQQFNLDVDNFPHSLPDKYNSIYKLFSHNNKVKDEKMTIKSGSKQTLAKKMKQWTAAEEEKALMDLEIMYLKSN